MLESLIWTTGLVLLSAMFIAYRRFKDPLHPLMFLGPLFLFVYVLQPAGLFYRNLLESYFPEMERLEFVQFLYLAGVICFSVGCLRGHKLRSLASWQRQPLELTLRTRRRLYVLGCALGAIGLTAYIYMIGRAGGFANAFAFAKGGGRAPSGYIGEAPLLVFPAVVLLLISWQGQRIGWRRLGMVLLFVMPFVLQGLLGSRRGPMFMALAILFLPWWLVFRKRPSLKSMIAGLCILGMAVLFVWSQREQLYIGSDFEFDREALVEKLLPSEVDTGHEYIFGAGQVLNATYHNKYYWGRRYFVSFFVRPIPRQIWPTKYEDMGMAMFAKGHSSFEDETDWKNSVGWVPLAGSAHGIVADLFIEFSWGALLMLYLIGAYFSYLWHRAVIEGGLWTLIYVEASVLSVYLPSQSLGAWLYRFMFMAIPTWYLWKFYIGPWQKARQMERQKEAAKKRDLPLGGRYAG